MRNWNSNYSLIRVLHAVPGGEQVDVYINETPFYKDLGFTEFSPYVYVPQGNYTITVYPADTQENPILSENINVNAGELVTIAVSGSENDIKLVPVVEETETVSGNNAKVRVVHLSPNAPNVNIMSNGQELFNNVGFRDATSYMVAPSGDYIINLEEATTGRLILKNRVILNPGRIYTLYVIGYLPNATVVQSLDGATFMN